jgi:hypothetical protein
LKRFGAPGGVEYLPGPCAARLSQEHFSELHLVEQLPLQEGLNRITAHDPRYEWRVDDGVVVFRPSAAWKEPEHFMHQTLRSFVLKDVTIGGALNLLATTLANYTVSGFDHYTSVQPRGMDKRFSSLVTDGTVLTAMDAIARNHGAALWEVQYCKAVRGYEFATVWFRTFDGGGSGFHTGVVDNNGLWREGCR